MFCGTNVVNAACLAAARPSESSATASTVYLVPAARWVAGRHTVPPSASFPSTFAPLESWTVTFVSLPSAAWT